MRRGVDFSAAKRGPLVPLDPGKTRITIRIDDDILDWFRTQVDAAGGGNYQTLMNDALRRAMTNEAETLEAIVRRAVRAELRRERPARAKRAKKAAA